MELRCAEGEGGRQGGERCGPQRGEVGHAERDRGERADEHAHEQGHLLEEAAAEPLDEQDDDEGEGGQRQVLHGAEVVGGGVAALRPGDRYRHEGDADEGDDHPGDEGGKKRSSLPKNGPTARQKTPATITAP